MANIVRRQLAGMREPFHYHPPPPQSVSLRAAAVGAFAVGALAVGAVAVGALAIGRLSVRKGRVGALEIDDLTVRRLRVGEAAMPRTAESGDRASTSQNVAAQFNRPLAPDAP